jgi:hypothetical protein
MSVENEFDINTNDLEGEFERSPAIFARLSEQYVEAFEAFSARKLQFEAEESRLRMLVREELTAQAETTFQMMRNSCKTATERGSIRLVKPSMDEVNDMLKATPAYMELREDLLRSEVRMKQAKVLADAARFKKDMLTNIGHLHNANMRNLVPPRALSDMTKAFISEKPGKH